jgi:hypothetical protein
MGFVKRFMLLLLLVASLATGAFAAKWGTLSRAEPLEIEMVDVSGNVVLSHGVPAGWPGVLAARMQTSHPPAPPEGISYIYPMANGWFGRGPTGQPFKLGGTGGP